jgi:FkbM family methyltransferase
VKLHYVDVGAANNTRESAWESNKSVRYTLFEPDPVAAEKLRQNSSSSTSVVESALGSASVTSTLNICIKRELSSVLEPNIELLERYPDASRWKIVDRLPIEINTLDSFISTIGRIDFLKLDTQGSELDILKGAASALNDVLAIQVEVEFIPLYIDQPLFGDISDFLLARGFEFWDFTTVYRYGRENLDRTGQAVFADALFLRSPESIMVGNAPLISLEKLNNLATIARVFGKCDIEKLCKEKIELL